MLPIDMMPDLSRRPLNDLGLLGFRNATKVKMGVYLFDYSSSDSIRDLSLRNGSDTSKERN